MSATVLIKEHEEKLVFEPDGNNPGTIGVLNFGPGTITIVGASRPFNDIGVGDCVKISAINQIKLRANHAPAVVKIF